jgi:hypothetical protein
MAATGNGQGITHESDYGDFNASIHSGMGSGIGPSMNPSVNAAMAGESRHGEH